MVVYLQQAEFDQMIFFSYEYNMIYALESCHVMIFNISLVEKKIVCSLLELYGITKGTNEVLI